MRKIQMLKEMLAQSREQMPQIDSPKDFSDHLKSRDIDVEHTHITYNKHNGLEIKPSQQDLDMDKVIAIRDNGHNKPIIVSRDGYVIDGHHRWAGDIVAGRSTPAMILQKNSLDLLRLARDYSQQQKMLDEGITHKEFGPMMDSFVSFATEKLGIQSTPNIRFKTDQDDFNSFAAYMPRDKSIVVAVKNRHPMDVFRSIAHELVHMKQDEDGRITDVAKEGETGSDIENEANALAGVCCRDWVSQNKEYFNLTPIVEDNDRNNEEAILTPSGRFYRKLEEMEAGFGDSLDRRPDLDPNDREWGTTSLRRNYERNTPGQNRWDGKTFKDAEIYGTTNRKKEKGSVTVTPTADVYPNAQSPKADNVNQFWTASLASGLTGLSAGTSIGYYNEEGKPERPRDRFVRILNELDKESMKCNSPRASPSGDKSHVVKACFDGKEKIIRFGQRGVRGSPKKDGESDRSRKRRNSFQARHRKNIAKGKSSAAYWANKVKW